MRDAAKHYGNKPIFLRTMTEWVEPWKWNETKTYLVANISNQKIAALWSVLKERDKFITGRLQSDTLREDLVAKPVVRVMESEQ